MGKQSGTLSDIFYRALQSLADHDAHVCELRGDYRQITKDLLDTALKDQPHDPRLQKLKGFFLAESGDYAAALPLLKSSAASLRDISENHAHYLGLSYFKVGNYTIALKYLLDLAKKFKGDADLNFITGYALFKNGNTDAALLYLKRSRCELDQESLVEFRRELHSLARAGLTKSALQPQPK